MALPSTVDHHRVGHFGLSPRLETAMQSALKALHSLQEALREALVQQDWGTIGSLDAQCRALIEAAGADDSALREPLEELSRLYVELQQAARAERELVVGELTRINKAKRADRQYQMFG